MFVEQIEGKSWYIGERYKSDTDNDCMEITSREKHHTMFNLCYNLSSNKRMGSNWVQSEDVLLLSDSAGRMACLTFFQWGRFRADKATVDWVYPFLMTQFPMFRDTFLHMLTPKCVTLMLHNNHGISTDDLLMETENLLKCIEITGHHTDVRYQLEVGKHVHVVMSGSTRRFMLWHNWLRVMPLYSEEYCGSNQSIMMLREQWMSWIPHGVKGAMAKEQNLLKYTVLTNGERKEVGGDDQIVYTEVRSRKMYRMYSTLTHLDIREQFLLIGTVVTPDLVPFPVPMAQGNQSPFVVRVAVLECTVLVQSIRLQHTF